MRRVKVRGRRGRAGLRGRRQASEGGSGAVTPSHPQNCDPPPPPRLPLPHADSPFMPPVGPNFSHHKARVLAVGWTPRWGPENMGQAVAAPHPRPPPRE